MNYIAIILDHLIAMMNVLNQALGGYHCFEYEFPELNRIN